MIDKQKYRELAEESWPSIYAAYEMYRQLLTLIQNQS